jgi:hypothetical protein
MNEGAGNNATATAANSEDSMTYARQRLAGNVQRVLIEQDAINRMSRGEALAVALVLNRIDWLDTMGCTIAAALDYIDDDVIPIIPTVARLVPDAQATIAIERSSALLESFPSEIESAQEDIPLDAKLVAFRHSPGYRHVGLVFELQGKRFSATHSACLVVSADDGKKLAEQIIEVHRSAWDSGKPIDWNEGEQRPCWIDQS